MPIPWGIIAKPGTTRQNKTGSWRTYRPVVDLEKCTSCGTCELFCPEGIIVIEKPEKYKTDYDFCKGCGICAEVCPYKALGMEMEVK